MLTRHARGRAGRAAVPLDCTTEVVAAAEPHLLKQDGPVSSRARKTWSRLGLDLKNGRIDMRRILLATVSGVAALGFALFGTAGLTATAPARQTRSR